MSKLSTSRQDRRIFGNRFDTQFRKWKSKEKGRNETVFGKLIEPPAGRGSVAKWRSGENIPSQSKIKQFCQIFGVPEDYFDIENATHDELYKNSANFIEGIGKKHVAFSKQIGLDLDLIRALSNCVDFDALFPLYSPIGQDQQTDPGTGEKRFTREVNYADSAHLEEVDETLRFLQVERGGKRITLHRCDLAFLKEVQDQLTDYVEYLFYKRSKEMQQEVQKFNEDFKTVEELPNGDTVERPAENGGSYR